MAKINKIVAALALAGSAAAWPPASPGCTTAGTPPSSTKGAADGFPTPNAAQLKDINQRADGTLSNAPPPAQLANSTLQSFQAIAFNEEFETAYFQSLLANVSSGHKDWNSWGNYGQAELEKVLKIVIAQEELHAINAVNVLTHFKHFAPLPCKYRFGVTNIHDAFAVAESFTALVVGTLQDVSQAAAASGDAGVVRAVASVIGQEGEQNGFYRTILGNVPSEKPFMTTNVGAFLFSFLNQNFIESCPFDVNSLNIPIFSQLKVDGASIANDVPPKDQQLKFSASMKNVKGADKYQKSSEGLFITYFSGQLLPISVPVKSWSWGKDSQVTFEAEFPFEENLMFGLSVAALTTSGNFSNPDAVPAATLAAPALIQVNDKL